MFLFMEKSNKEKYVSDYFLLKDCTCSELMRYERKKLMEPSSLTVQSSSHPGSKSKLFIIALLGLKFSSDPSFDLHHLFSCVSFYVKKNNLALLKNC